MPSWRFRAKFALIIIRLDYVPVWIIFNKPIYVYIYIYIYIYRFFRVFFLSCKTNASVKLAKGGTARPLPSYLLFVLFGCYLCCSMIFVLFYVLFLCKCVLYYSHRLSTQLQLTNISYRIISYHIISYIIYHISYRIISYILSYHIVSYHIIYHIVSYITYHISYITHCISYHIISYHKSYIDVFWNWLYLLLDRLVVIPTFLCCIVHWMAGIRFKL